MPKSSDTAERYGADAGPQRHRPPEWCDRFEDELRPIFVQALDRDEERRPTAHSEAGASHPAVSGR